MTSTRGCLTVWLTQTHLLLHDICIILMNDQVAPQLMSDGTQWWVDFKIHCQTFFTHNDFLYSTVAVLNRYYYKKDQLNILYMTYSDL